MEFSTSHDEICQAVFLINKFQPQSFLHIRQEETCCKNFGSKCITKFSTSILKHSLSRRISANFEQLHILNGCVDLAVQYTVGKGTTQFTWRQNHTANVYNLRGQNIRQISEKYCSETQLFEISAYTSHQSRKCKDYHCKKYDYTLIKQPGVENYSVFLYNGKKTWQRI